MADGIAARDGEVNPRIAGQADLQASDLALLATADDPALGTRVLGILPDDDLLQRIVAFDDATPPPWVSTGTTTTTTTTLAPASRPPEPGAEQAEEPADLPTTAEPLSATPLGVSPRDPSAGNRPGGG